MDSIKKSDRFLNLLNKFGITNFKDNTNKGRVVKPPKSYFSSSHRIRVANNPGREIIPILRPTPTKSAYAVAPSNHKSAFVPVRSPIKPNVHARSLSMLRAVPRPTAFHLAEKRGIEHPESSVHPDASHYQDSGFERAHGDSSYCSSVSSVSKLPASAPVLRAVPRPTAFRLAKKRGIEHRERFVHPDQSCSRDSGFERTYQDSSYCSDVNSVSKLPASAPVLRAVPRPTAFRLAKKRGIEHRERFVHPDQSCSRDSGFERTYQDSSYCSDVNSVSKLPASAPVLRAVPRPTAFRLAKKRGIEHLERSVHPDASHYQDSGFERPHGDSSYSSGVTNVPKLPASAPMLRAVGPPRPTAFRLAKKRGSEHRERFVHPNPSCSRDSGFERTNPDLSYCSGVTSASKMPASRASEMKSRWPRAVPQHFEVPAARGPRTPFEPSTPHEPTTPYGPTPSYGPRMPFRPTPAEEDLVKKEEDDFFKTLREFTQSTFTTNEILFHLNYLRSRMEKKMKKLSRANQMHATLSGSVQPHDSSSAVGANNQIVRPWFLANNKIEVRKLL